MRNDDDDDAIINCRLHVCYVAAARIAIFIRTGGDVATNRAEMAAIHTNMYIKCARIRNDFSSGGAIRND